MDAFALPLLGGILLGLSAAILLLVNGRIAGVSGLIGWLFKRKIAVANLFFVIGLLAGPVIYVLLGGTLPRIEITTPLPLVIAAGLLVGFGSRMGSGCTSGHGIMGLARLSKRSLAAVLTFIATGVVTVAVLRNVF
jgi:uncharacterized membrane protein YedE/YeeE